MAFAVSVVVAVPAEVLMPVVVAVTPEVLMSAVGMASAPAQATQVVRTVRTSVTVAVSAALEPTPTSPPEAPLVVDTFGGLVRGLVVLAKRGSVPVVPVVLAADSSALG